VSKCTPIGNFLIGLAPDHKGDLMIEKIAQILEKSSQNRQQAIKGQNIYIRPP
jgi:hypothetical protein